jgi:hypothetical protein
LLTRKGAFVVFGDLNEVSGKQLAEELGQSVYNSVIALAKIDDDGVGQWISSK